MATPLVSNKRVIVRSSVLVACTIAALFLAQCGVGEDLAIFVKEPLPYNQDALAPTISADTMGFHYDKHYAGYVNKANELTKGMVGKTAEAVIQATAGDASKAAIFNNAAQGVEPCLFLQMPETGRRRGPRRDGWWR